MEPDSTFLVALLLVVSGGLVYVAIRFRPIAAKIASGTGALVIAAVAGMVMVNVYYGYYQTWSQLSSDFSGNYSSFTTPVRARAAGPGGDVHGQMESVVFRGAASGIARTGGLIEPGSRTAR